MVNPSAEDGMATGIYAVCSEQRWQAGRDIFVFIPHGLRAIDFVS